MTNSSDPLAVPGAKPTLPISAGKKPFDNAFIAEARKYWSNFHMQMGGDHALYYTSHLSELTKPEENLALIMKDGKIFKNHLQ